MGLKKDLDLYMKMNKKDILIVFTGSMELGGIEKSLINLLNTIDYARYNVDLFLYAHHGSLIDQINHNVNLLPEVKELAYLRESLMTKLRNRCFYSAFKRVSDGIRGVHHDITWRDIMRKNVKNMPHEYDLAIGYFRSFDLLKEKVKAKKKVGWIHTDYSVENEDAELVHDDYYGLDQYIAVSEKCAAGFRKVYPDLASKVRVIENIMDCQEILDSANECIKLPFRRNSVNLLSIGRFCTAKNFDSVPEICSLLQKEIPNICWYIIGYGSDESLIRDKIKEYHMEEHVILLGRKDNPYPFIKHCDLYVQPSRYEGKALTVVEAQILSKPVIIAAYPTAPSQLRDGIDGIIVPQDPPGMAVGIYKVLKDAELQNKVIENCQKSDYSNREQIEHLYQLMEE